MNKTFFVFPILVFLTYFIGLFESVVYLDFVRSKIYFVFQFFLVIVMICGFVIRAYIPSEKLTKIKWIKFYRNLAKINVLLFLVLLVVTIIMSVIEKTHFPGYVLEKYHLQPKNLYWVLFVNCYLFFLDLGNLTHSKIFNCKLYLKNSLKNSISLALVFWLTAFSVRSGAGYIFNNLFFIVSNPTASYDQKMSKHWGEFYNYMVFIRNNTPENAKIAHPPWEIPPWLSTGSQPLVRYFLYPRILLQTKEKVSVSREAEYVMVDWGFWKCPDDRESDCSYGWPKVKLPGEWIIYKEDEGIEIVNKLTDVEYEPGEAINQGAWGLIKLKKEQLGD